MQMFRSMKIVVAFGQKIVKLARGGLKLDFRTCSLHVGWCYFALMKHERLLPFNFDARRTTRILTNGATAAMALCDNNPFRTSSNCLSTKFTRRLQPTLKGSSKYRQQEVSTFLSIENLSPTIQSSNEKKETSTIIIHSLKKNMNRLLITDISHLSRFVSSDGTTRIIFVNITLGIPLQTPY